MVMPLDTLFSGQNRSTLMNRALNHLRQAILRGRLKPGDRLVESRLAREMNISRFPIREALRYLEKEGLAENIPFRGSVVAQFSEQDMEEVFSLRGALEGLALQIVTHRISDTQLNELADIIHDMETASGLGDSLKVVDHDLRFHQTICQMTGHKKLLLFLETLSHHIHMFLVFEKKVYDPPERYVPTHHPILEALRKRDADLAAARLRIHLEDAMNQIRTSLFSGQP